MLLQRVVTAVVLLVVLLLVSVFLPPVWFRLFMALSSALVIWEWLRIATLTSRTAAASAGVYFIIAAGVAITGFDDALATTGSAVAAYPSRAAWVDPLASVLGALGLLFWTIMAPLSLSHADTQRSPRSLISLGAGIVVTAASALGLSMLHQQYGAWFIFSFLGVIWCADTFAYFGGKRFGGPRLAPTISPGKTRSGALCGLIAAVAWIGVTLFIGDSFAAYLHQYVPAILVLLGGALLGIYSMIGDLYESLIKRRASVKDSSNLLPGHGGVWDRFDSILSVTPVVLCLWLFIRHFY